MSGVERNNLLDKINFIEKKIKDITEDNIRIMKNKEIMKSNIDYMKEEIENKQKEVMKKIKLISMNVDKSSNDQTQDNIMKHANLVNQEDMIKKYLLSIQKNYNLNINEKLRGSLEKLLAYKKTMKVNYIIVKKIDIREDFLKEKKIPISSEIFDNLKSLSKAGLLNYNSLKLCGPILLYKLTESSTLQEIKKSCCELWNVSYSFYSLYDDSFNNLECVSTSKVNDFFANYEIIDKTLKPGEVCFYLLENLKNQNGYLDSQMASIDTKSSSNVDESNKSQNDGVSEMRKCMEFLRNKQILKGIDSYRAKREPEGSSIKENMKMVDNYHIFIMASLLFIILSIVSISYKKSINKFGVGMWVNRFMLSKYFLSKQTQIYNSNLNNLTGYNSTNSGVTSPSSYSDYLQYYSWFISEAINPQIKKTYIPFGPIRIRFMRTNMITNECLQDYLDNNIISKQTIIDLNMACYSTDFISDYRNSSPIYKYNYSSDLNITYTLDTSIATYDNTGIVIDFFNNDTESYKKLRDLQYIIHNPNKYLDLQLRAVELSFTYFMPALDIFITNLILIERDMNNKPVITIHESIPFLLNIYETEKDKYYLKLDYARIILSIVLIFSFILRYIQKFMGLKEKKVLSGIFLFFQVLVQLKHIILLTGIILYLVAFSNFNSDYLVSQDMYTSKAYYDYYSFASSKKTSYNLEIISLFLIILYSLKFLQILDKVNIVFNAFKRAYFEYLILSIIVIVIFLSLSFLTNFIYGTYIYEYSTFAKSILMNFKIFILSEQADVTRKFLSVFRTFSIVIMVIFIFLFRYFLLNLYYPIFIEYFRIELDNYLYNESKDKKEGVEFTIKEKFKFFLAPYNYKKNKPQTDHIENENDKL